MFYLLSVEADIGTIVQQGNVGLVSCKSFVNYRLKIDSKCSLSCFFQDHNLHAQIKSYVHAFSLIFFPLRSIFFKIPNLKGINGTPKLCNKKYRSPCSYKS